MNRAIAIKFNDGDLSCMRYLGPNCGKMCVHTCQPAKGNLAAAVTILDWGQSRQKLVIV